MPWKKIDAPAGRAPVKKGHATKKKKKKYPPTSRSTPQPPQPASPSDDGSMDDDDSEYSNPNEAPLGHKDELEKELEKLVFGEEDAFKQELYDFQQDAAEYDFEAEERRDLEKLLGEQEESEGEAGEIADKDLFLLDAGPSEASALTGSEERGSPTNRKSLAEAPAWEDSDDERIRVSLATNTRLRKLRTYEGEDVIDGVEYSKRLRKQYELLHPLPKWVRQAQQAMAERQRSTPSSRNHARQPVGDGQIPVAASSDESMLDSEQLVSSDSSPLSVPPLAQFLQSTASLLRKPSRSRKLSHRPRHIALRPTILNIARSKDVARPSTWTPARPTATPGNPVRALSFHPTLPVLLISGGYGRIAVHHFTLDTGDEPPYPRLATLQYQNTSTGNPAYFSAGGSQVYISGALSRYYHTWTLSSGLVQKSDVCHTLANPKFKFRALRPSPCGRYIALSTNRSKGGGLQILSAKTGLWVCGCGIEGRGGVADFAWWADGRGVLVASHNGEMFEYDVKQKQVVCRWFDEGAVGTTVIALSGTGTAANPPMLDQDISSSDEEHASGPRSKQQSLGSDLYVAIGSISGIVNVYERSSITVSSGRPSTRPKPLKTLENIITPISQLCFSPCAQILAYASTHKRNALKICHLSSGGTVYRNWPTSQTDFGRVSAIAMAYTPERNAHGGQDGQDDQQVLNLVVGNDNGQCRCWEIRE